MGEQERAQGRMRAAAEQLLAFLREDMEGTIAARVPLWLADCDAAEDSITVSVETLPWMAGVSGDLANGVLSIILDEVMGTISCLSAGGRMTPTVTMDLSFLHPVPATGKLMVKAWLTSRGDRSNFTAARLWSPSAPERALVTATGIYFSGGRMVDLSGGRRETGA